MDISTFNLAPPDKNYSFYNNLLSSVTTQTCKASPKYTTKEITPKTSCANQKSSGLLDGKGQYATQKGYCR